MIPLRISVAGERLGGTKGERNKNWEGSRGEGVINWGTETSGGRVKREGRRDERER